jgi:hypothetical protein
LSVQLNTLPATAPIAVCLGLDLLETEFKLDPEAIDVHVDNLHQVQESCRIAVDILNDLLQYDKLQDHDLRMSFSEQRAVPMFAAMLTPFQIQVHCTMMCVCTETDGLFPVRLYIHLPMFVCMLYF